MARVSLRLLCHSGCMKNSKKPSQRDTGTHSLSYLARINLPPRLIRMRDAPGYLGIDRNRFNAEVRPFLIEIPFGRQVITFDRLEIDAWIEDYIQRNGRPGQACSGGNTWEKEKHRASSKDRGFGISTNASAGGEFAKALEVISSGKQSNT